MKKPTTESNTENEVLSFEAIIPDFQYSVSGSLATFRITPVEAAEGYEIYRSENKTDGYSLFRESTAPLIDF
ncbi:MAG: hypothetical protein J6X19_03405, partial [Clostridia bacterium]|nr:hypothetical protein [Clostridia bacterium]